MLGPHSSYFVVEKADQKEGHGISFPIGPVIFFLPNYQMFRGEKNFKRYDDVQSATSLWKKAFSVMQKRVIILVRG